MGGCYDNTDNTAWINLVWMELLFRNVHRVHCSALESDAVETQCPSTVSAHFKENSPVVKSSQFIPSKYLPQVNFSNPMIMYILLGQLHISESMYIHLTIIEVF